MLLTVGGYLACYLIVIHNAHWIYNFVVAYALLTCAVISLVLMSRYHRLSAVRVHVSFFFQLRLFMLRGIIQQIRAWKFSVLDIALPLVAAPFVGVFYYHRPYIGPILSPFDLDIGKNFDCPDALLKIYPPLCVMLSIPADDPIPAAASLTSLALALSAVASSLRIFGDEQENFKRESSSGKYKKTILFSSRNFIYSLFIFNSKFNYFSFNSQISFH
jgi:hypothetical protein